MELKVQVTKTHLESLGNCQPGRFKLVWDSLPSEQRDRSKTDSDTRPYSTLVDHIINQNDSLLSLISSQSKLIQPNSTWVLIRSNFPSPATLQAIGDPPSNYILMSTFSYTLLFHHTSMKTNLNSNVIHFCGCKVKVLTSNSMFLSNVRSIISNPPQRQSS